MSAPSADTRNLLDELAAKADADGAVFTRTLADVERRIVEQSGIARCGCGYRAGHVRGQECPACGILPEFSSNP